MLRDRTDESLATELRSLRNLMRPVANELRARGYSLTEKHGRTFTPMTTFENIQITKPTTVRL